MTFARQNRCALIALIIASFAGASYALPVAGGAPGENLVAPVGSFDDLNEWGGSYLKTRMSSQGVRPGSRCLVATSEGAPAGKTAHCFIKSRRLDVALVSERDYELSVKFRTVGGAQAMMTMYMYDDKDNMYRAVNSHALSSKGWSRLVIPFRSTPQLKSLGLVLVVRQKGEVHWDDLELTYRPPAPVFDIERTDGELKIRTQLDESILIKAASRELTARVTIFSPLGGEVALSQDLPVSSDLKIDGGVDISKADFGVYRIRTDILNGQIKLQTFNNVFLPGLDDAWPGMKEYTRVVNDEIEVDIKEASHFAPQAGRKMEMFNRPEPRWIAPDSLPLPHELVSQMRQTVARGDYVFMTVAGLATEDLQNVHVSLEDADGGEQQISRLADVKVGKIRYWPQKMYYGKPADLTPGYWIIPELIEPMAAHNLKQGIVQQYSIGLRVPAEAAGKHRGRLVVRADGEQIAAVDVVLDVLPITIAPADDMLFGLYVDPVRWVRETQRFTDEGILDELRDVREHGYTSLYLAAAVPIVDVHYKEGKLTLLPQELPRHLRLAREAGFDKHPYIICPYAMERTIQGRAGQPAAKGKTYDEALGSAMEQFFTQLHEVAVKPGWPEPVITGVDESTHGERLDHSWRKLSAARKAGFRTACTTYEHAIRLNPGYGQLLDFPLYSNPGFWEMRTEDQINKLKGMCKEYGHTFWTYGPGCYADYSPITSRFRKARQEGCLTENRYLNGLFVYRSGVQGSWTWTFSRYENDPENDFDNPHLSKEQCIVYPPADGKGRNRDTLQWEALRQGWQDYQTVRMLSDLLAASNTPKSAAIKAQLDKRLSQIPLANYTQYPQAELQSLREWMLEQIAQLQ